MKKYIFFIVTFLVISITLNCEKSESFSIDTINGTYSYKDSHFEGKISVYGNSWRGQSEFLNGIESDVEYSNGIIKGKDLYDESGLVKIGHIYNGSLSTSIGGSTIVLNKD